MTNVNKALAQSLITTPARAFGESGPFGQVVVLRLTTTPVYVDLQKLTFGATYDPTNAQTNAGSGAPPKGPIGAVGSYLSIYADSVDVGYVTGSSKTSVMTSPPDLALVGTLDVNGVYSGVNGTCDRVPAGSRVRVRLQVGVDNALALVGSGTGIVRLYVSSEAGLQS